MAGIAFGEPCDFLPDLRHPWILRDGNWESFAVRDSSTVINKTDHLDMTERPCDACCVTLPQTFNTPRFSAICAPSLTLRKKMQIQHPEMPLLFAAGELWPLGSPQDVQARNSTWLGSSCGCPVQDQMVRKRLGTALSGARTCLSQR